MNIEDLREFCLNITGASECLPFDEYSLVFKVFDKMFALLPLDNERLCISIKCDPEKAIELREHYSAVEPAWHFNKKYWNTVYLDSDMEDEEVKKWILHSVNEVVKKLPKKIRDGYQ